MDSEDPRAKGFLHLILLLRTMDTPPEYLFVENVCNFEVPFNQCIHICVDYNRSLYYLHKKSMTRQTLVDALRELHYEFEEWILSPTQFGIPNERPRYYLIARRVFSGTVNNTTLYDSAPPRTDWKGRMFSPNPIPVSSFLDKAVDFEALAIPPSFLKTRSWLSSVVIAKPEELTTCCFTKAYGHHGLRAGSFLQTAEIQDYDSDLLDSPEEAAKVLSLRMFSPDEVARLHHFPIGKEFTFPPTLSTQQRWKVIGNSMNVFVVGSLLKRLFTEREWM